MACSIVESSSPSRIIIVVCHHPQGGSCDSSPSSMMWQPCAAVVVDDELLSVCRDAAAVVDAELPSPSPMPSHMLGVTVLERLTLERGCTSRTGSASGATGSVGSTSGTGSAAAAAAAAAASRCTISAINANASASSLSWWGGMVGGWGMRMRFTTELWFKSECHIPTRRSTFCQLVRFCIICK